ncbi:MAG: F0F1 ATP synthase subunit A, partial [Flavobacteriales bacterium]|nr:F0F1 ATP synthase subunit A [Flavobacteriales bacterium]
MNNGKYTVIAISLAVFFTSIFNNCVAQGDDVSHNEEIVNNVIVDSEESLDESDAVLEKESFNAGEMIMEHIDDSHEWHLWGKGSGSVSVPLPIILYHQDNGFSIFMSSNFHHGHTAYKGYRLLTEHFLHKHEIDPNDYPHDMVVAVTAEGKLDKASTLKIWDFSITKNVAALLTSVFLLMWIFISIAKTYNKRIGQAPTGMQSFMEPIIMFIRDDIAKPSIGDKYEKFMPYLLTLFFFIWINNVMGLIPLIPGGTNLTGNIAIPIVLALFTFVLTTINGNAHYWKHIFVMPGVPKPILLILTPLEVVGIFIKPIVLVIRLFANITAGHIVMLVFFSLIFIFGETSVAAGYGVSVASVAFTVFLTFLELLVGVIQAYVFTLLSAIYFGMATA